MTTLAAALSSATTQLHTLSPTPRLDAEVLLAWTLAKPRSFLLAWPEYLLNAQQADAYAHALVQRQQGRPVAYITGVREFWSLPLTVNAATLIPRPETELLVEQALERIPTDQTLQILDLGTGSGAIALALAHERPLCSIVATDCSAEALAIAQDNALKLRLDRVEFRHGDWFTALDAQHTFDLIISNPPYVACDSVYLTQGDCRFEPRSALLAGVQGLDAINHITAHAPAYLKRTAWLLLEHGYDQGPKVMSLLSHYGFTAIRDIRDYGDLSRVTVAQWLY